MIFTERLTIYEIDDREDLKRRLLQIGSYSDIFELVYHYNWDDGFTLPEIISELEYCDMATALLLFYFSDGYRFLMKEEFLDNECRSLCEYIFNRIESGVHSSNGLSFNPGLNKVQKYKIMKLNPQLDGKLINGV